jgi:TonB family protein
VSALITGETAANDNAANPANDNALAPAPGAVPTELEMQNVTHEIALDEDDAATGWRGLALLIVVSIAGARGAVRRDRARRARRPGEGPQTAADRGDRGGGAATARAGRARGETGAEGRAQSSRSVRPRRRHRTRRHPRRRKPRRPPIFSGTTLTNDGPGEGWASAVGNGETMHGPIGRPGAKVTARTQDGTTKPSPAKAAPVVALASLSRPPEPPDLNDALERHYPEAARKQGTPGQAVLKARITAEGQVRDMVVVSQSAAGFGDACRATLRESKWSPPLDKEGPAGRDVHQLHLPVRSSMTAQAGVGCDPACPSPFRC